MTKRMTNKQKHIASCVNPYYDNLATREQVKEAKLLARGRYWYDSDFEKYVSFSPGGKRKFFDHEWFGWGTARQKTRWKKEARLAARLWSEGKYKEALRVHCDSYLLSHKD